MPHDHKSPEYNFDEGAEIYAWRWQDMVQQVTTDSLKKIFGGLPNDPAVADTAVTATEQQDHFPPSRNIIGCQLCNNDRYDHLTDHKIRKRNKKTKGEKETIDPQSRDGMHTRLDFVLTREDGTQLYFHPDWNSTKV